MAWYDTGFDLGSGYGSYSSPAESFYTPTDYSSAADSFYQPLDYGGGFTPSMSWDNTLNLGMVPTSLVDNLNLSVMNQPTSIATSTDDSLWGSLGSKLGSAWDQATFGDIVGAGAGALGGLGNLWAYYDQRKRAEDALEAQAALREKELAQQAALAREQQRLGAGDDFSKMHALAQILRDRQGINLNPSLAYAEAVRKEMGLSPASATPFVGDVGGPMRIQEQTAAKQAALQQALGQPVQYTAQFAGGGYYAGGGSNRGGALGLLRGGTGGQDDSINASISDGEYVMDAETVSMLGDGNTEAGAAKLDEMRQNIRSHKRSASPKKIAPKAKGALSYLKGK